MRAYEDDPAFLEIPLARLHELMDPDEATESRIETIGPFRVVRPLGRGGMGEVFLARQTIGGADRPVALKIIKPGMDTVEVLKRFALERRILASLQHPNIAQFLDAGATADGRPYFVMEFIDGERIDAFANGHDLAVPERLRLFQAVCGAVQHAHQNLIVHRDIKPGNVLVTAEGVPKLLDFGIGKVLSDPSDPTASDVSLTRTRARVLTPEYASPEQLRGEPVTTATDVYALGVLLYQLLTGHRPFEEAGDSYETLARAICEDVPSRPSEMVATGTDRGTRDLAHRRRQLTGDLDTIVLKALRKEPERRYQSAAALSEDIERHLNGLPILARGDAFGYRAGKFLRRNRWAVATTTAIALGLIGTTGVTITESRRVIRERNKAQEVQSFLLETFGASAADGLAGDSVTVGQILDRQTATVATAYNDQPDLHAVMLSVLADAYERLGIYGKAERLARDALALDRSLHTGDHPDVAAALNLLGWTRHQQGESEEAVTLLRESVGMWRRLGSAHRERLSRALNDLGAVLDQLGRREEAEPPLREALAIRREVFGPDHRSVGITASNLAVLLYRRGEYAAADSLGSEALAALRASLGPDHQRSIIAQGNLAQFRMAAGDLAGSEVLQRDLLDRQERTGGRRNPRTASVMVNYANLLRALDRPAEAESLLWDALAIQEETLGPSHRSLAGTLRVLGTVLSQQRRFDDALPVLQRAVEVARAAYGDTHAQVGATIQALGLGYLRAGRRDLAIREHERAVAVFDEALGRTHPRSVDARVRLGAALIRFGRALDALRVLGEAHRLAMDRRPSEPILVYGSVVRMAEAQLALGNVAAADSLAGIVESAIETLRIPPSIRSRARRLRAAIDSAVR